MRKPRWNVAKAKELAAKALQNRGKIMMNFDISELARICDNCRFAGAGEDDDEVECRRRPPEAAFKGLSGIFATFPVVNKYGWCGEWEMRR